MDAGELFGIISMLAATGAGIVFLDFILRNVGEAFDDAGDDLADGDWPALPQGLRLPSNKVGEDLWKAREPVTRTETTSHNSIPVRTQEPPL